MYQLICIGSKKKVFDTMVSPDVKLKDQQSRFCDCVENKIGRIHSLPA